MFNYILRRLLYGVLVLVGVNLLTFVLFLRSTRLTIWRA